MKTQIIADRQKAITESYNWDRYKRANSIYNNFYLPAVENYFSDYFNVFIEAGVFEGDVSLFCSEMFREVHAIEISEKLCKRLRKRFQLQTKKNIKLHKGDSQYLLPKVLKKISEPAFFWLDAHYSGPDTGGDPDYIPILEELKSIRDWNQKCIVIIDDANKFGNSLDLPDAPESGYLAHAVDWTHVNTEKIYSENNHHFNHNYWADEKRLVYIKNE